MTESATVRNGDHTVSRLSAKWLLTAVIGFLAVTFIAARVPALNPAPPAAAQIAGHSAATDYENDPEWLDELRRSEEDAAAFQKEAEAFYRSMTGEPESADATDTPAGGTSAASAAAQDAAARRTTVAAIQTTLQAAGCYTMKVDGLWGAGSRRATAEFARRQGLDLGSSEPTPTLAALLEENFSGERVCPLVCDARHEAKGDRCVLKTCAKGQVLDKAGRCVTAPSGKISSKATVRSCPAGTGRASDGGCWPIRNGHLCHPTRIDKNAANRIKTCRQIRADPDGKRKGLVWLLGKEYTTGYFHCNC